MPKQYQGRRHLRVTSDQAPGTSQSSSEGKEGSSSSGEGDSRSSRRYTKPGVDPLQRSGVTSTGVHSWCHSLGSPEVPGSLDLGLTRSSSLLREGTDAAGVGRPSSVGDEPVEPTPDASGKTDHSEERRYRRRVDGQDQGTAEEGVVYDPTRSGQSPQSLAVCGQRPSYEEAGGGQDVTEYLGLVYKTRLTSVGSPARAEPGGLGKFVTPGQPENQSTVDYPEAPRRTTERVGQSVPGATAPSEELEARTLPTGTSSGRSQLKRTLVSSPTTTPRTVRVLLAMLVSYYKYLSTATNSF